MSSILVAAQHKNIFALSVASVGVLVCSFGCSRNRPHEDKWPDQSGETQEKYANRLAPPKYQLISDGGHLYLDYDGHKFDVVKGDPNPIRIESHLESKMTVVIDGDKEVTRRKLGFLMASVWSEKHQSLSFATCNFGEGLADDSGKDDRTRLWSWDRKNGLKLLLDWNGEMIAQDGSPREMRGSVDGEYLAFHFRKYTKQQDHDKSEIVVYSLGKQHAFRYPVPENGPGYFAMDHCSILDSRTLLVAGERPKILDLKTGLSKPVALPGGTFPMINFHGQMWALHFMNGKYDIVQINSTLDKIEQTVEIPARFPKPLRPPDYEDGGD